ncbi:family 16 glycosylhydrolase [Dactylosporangium salmoneum]|uniref:F5/8 type C domain-containing protein n=1 Tax=Dactylosporangium salmoneum TaxID=53361 RepID=A0ABN3H2B0_9ACTN
MASMLARKVVLSAALALMCTVIVPSGQVAQGAPPGAQLLSYAKPGSASSSQDDGQCVRCTPDKLFDADSGTRWAASPTTGWVDPGWVQVDLGAPASITRVELQWESAYATGYDVQVSDDASSWHTIYATTTGHGFHEDLSVTGQGRYVRLELTKRAGQYGYSLYDVNIYGTGGDPVAPPNQAPDPDFTRLNLVWSDEFDGPAGSRPDPAKWTVETGTGQNHELQYYTDNENIAMDGQGHAVFEARKEDRGGMHYTSARLNTYGKFAFQYGRVEARIKVPDGNGMWPAFWMMGTNYFTGTGWPYDGEVDMMEVLGRNTAEAYSTIHGPQYFGGNGIGQKYTQPGGAKLSGDFHTWTADWDRSRIRFSLDGRPVFTVNKADVQATRGPWVYDHPFYVILNLAVGGDFPGNPDATTPFPAQMAVDYVRVYQSQTPPGGDGPAQTVTATVPAPPGEFSWTIDAGDHAVVLSDAVNKGSYLQSTGALKPVKVSDTRAGGPAWSVSGQVGDFTGGLSGKYLGWTPAVLSGAATAGDAVPAGIDVGNGLAEPSVLGSAPTGHAAGTATLGAGLDLRVPVDTVPGTYTTTLTLTALS